MVVLLGAAIVIVFLIVGKYEKYKHEWRTFDEMLTRAKDGFDERWNSR